MRGHGRTGNESQADIALSRYVLSTLDKPVQNVETGQMLMSA